MSSIETAAAVHTAAVLGVALNLETIALLARKNLITEVEAVDLCRRAIANTPPLHQQGARDILNGLVPGGAF